MSKKKFKDKTMLPTPYFCAKFVGHLNQLFIDLCNESLIWLGFTIPYMAQGKRSGSAERLSFHFRYLVGWHILTEWYHAYGWIILAKELIDESRNKKLRSKMMRYKVY